MTDENIIKELKEKIIQKNHMHSNNFDIMGSEQYILSDTIKMKFLNQNNDFKVILNNNFSNSFSNINNSNDNLLFQNINLSNSIALLNEAKNEDEYFINKNMSQKLINTIKYLIICFQIKHVQVII
jgi:hypothetical protein